MEAAASSTSEYGSQVRARARARGTAYAQRPERTVVVSREPEHVGGDVRLRARRGGRGRRRAAAPWASIASASGRASAEGARGVGDVAEGWGGGEGGGDLDGEEERDVRQSAEEWCCAAGDLERVVAGYGRTGRRTVRGVGVDIGVDIRFVLEVGAGAGGRRRGGGRGVGGRELEPREAAERAEDGE